MHPSCSPKKNSTSLKFQPPFLTNLKREKDFFFSFRFKTTSLAPPVTLVASAQRDATLAEPEKARIRAQKLNHAKLIERRNLSG
jgi:hypothetical protein